MESRLLTRVTRHTEGGSAHGDDLYTRPVYVRLGHPEQQPKRVSGRDFRAIIGSALASSKQRKMGTIFRAACIACASVGVKDGQITTH